MTSVAAPVAPAAGPDPAGTAKGRGVHTAGSARATVASRSSQAALRVVCGESGSEERQRTAADVESAPLGNAARAAVPPWPAAPPIPASPPLPPLPPLPPDPPAAQNHSPKFPAEPPTPP